MHKPDKVVHPVYFFMVLLFAHKKTFYAPRKIAFRKKDSNLAF